MIFIKKLGRFLNKNGCKVTIAIFFCVYCEQYVERQISYKNYKSCGCKKKELTIESKKGYKHTEETRQKIRLANKGKKRTEEFKNSRIGKNNPFYGSKKFIGKNNPFYGKNHTEETRQQMKDNHIDYSGQNNPMYDVHRFGENNPNWAGGKSFFESYGSEFNKEKKQQILGRDNYTCQNPECKIEHPKRLDIHHINYDKKNNNSENLITLCHSCHSKTNGKKKRNYFMSYYQEIMRVLHD